MYKLIMAKINMNEIIMAKINMNEIIMAKIKIVKVMAKLTITKLEMIKPTMSK
jgi:hypothetical protein